MSFCLLAKETVEEGIKRIVNEEMTQAIKEIDSPRLKQTETIHEVRKPPQENVNKKHVVYFRTIKIDQ